MKEGEDEGVGLDLCFLQGIGLVGRYEEGRYKAMRARSTPCDCSWFVRLRSVFLGEV